MQSQMKERQKLRRVSTAPIRLTQDIADSGVVQVALLAVMQKEVLDSKKKFDKEALLAMAGDKEGIEDVLHQYDADGWKYQKEDGQLPEEQEHKDGEESHSREKVIARKKAEQQLEAEIRREQYQNEQLKQSSLKQVCSSHLHVFC